MPSGIRVAVIGGGSSYTPEFIAGIIRYRDRLPVERLTLVDIPEGAEKQKICTAFAQRLFEQARWPVKLESTLDRRQALTDADFVLTQFRVGGLKARARDENIPLKYDAIGQETVGAGGFAKALRTIPVALDLAREVMDQNPSAWILNFTNPAGVVTEAILRQGFSRAVGLCNVPITLQRRLAQELAVEPARIGLDMLGLNHLSFARRIFLDGQDITDRVLAMLSTREASGAVNIPREPWEWHAPVLQAVGMIPSDYLKYYWYPRDMLRRQKADLEAGKGTRAIQVMAVEAELFRKYQDPGLVELPRELSQRDGAYYSDAALEVMAAITTNTSREIVVNTQNGNALPELPASGVVEMSCRVDGMGPHPLYGGPIPLTVRGLVQNVKAYEQLTIEAAVTGRRDIALAALMNNPLVPSADLAEKILADILKENAAFLPQFES